MNTQRILPFLLILASSFTWAEELKATSIAEKQADYAVSLFLSACNSTQANEAAIQAFVKKEGFMEAPPRAKAMFLFGGSGQAWSKSTSMGPFAISLSSQGLCSIFSARSDAEFMKKLLVSWLPPKEAGFTTETGETTNENGLETTSYIIKLNGKSYADWVISTSSLPNASLQGLITYQKR